MDFEPVKMHSFYSVSSLILVFIQLLGAFNVDVSQPKIFQGPRDSYFGFSVGLLSNDDGNWLLVGAPNSNSSLQSYLREPGVLYKCDATSSDAECQPVKLDDEGNTVHRPDPRGIFNYHNVKDGQFLGAALDVDPRTGNVVVCAPLWKDQNYQNHYLANGMCYELTSSLNFSTVKQYRPLTVSRQQIIIGGIYFYAHGEVGITAHYTQDSPATLVLGSPGVKDWTGTVVEYTNGKNTVLRTPDVLPDLSYTGYSISSGKIVPGHISRVLGAPRMNGHGKIFIIRDDFQILIEREGDQMGSYFGASVQVVNINGDEYDDLLVGAPLYRDSVGDEGRVYVYINERVNVGNLLTRSIDLLSGSNQPFARFGSAISGIGDLNKDGFDDVVIGAPYEDNGRGAVYVYLGGLLGVREKPVQRIRSSAIDTGLRGFGFSLSRGNDMDGNGYPDFAVGAYNSDRTVLLYTKPVISLYVSLEASPAFVNMSSTEYDCIHNGVRHVCANISFHYWYIGFDYHESHILVNISISADTLYKNTPNAIKTRVKLLNRDGHLVTTLHDVVTVYDALSLPGQRQQAYNCKALIQHGIQDFLTPIIVEANVNMIASQSDLGYALSPYHSTHSRATLSFLKSCGQDNACQSDLDLKSYVMLPNLREHLLLGADDHVIIRIDIENHGEPAYMTLLEISYPTQVKYQGVSQLRGDATVACDAPRSDYGDNITQSTLVCDVGNPMPGRSRTVLDVKLNIKKLSINPSDKHHLPVLIINVTVSTDSHEVNESLSNNVTHSVPVALEAKYSLHGLSLPDQVVYSTNHSSKDKMDNTTNDIMVDVTHKYDVLNIGPSLLPPSIVEITVPTLSKSGNILANVSELEIFGSSLFGDVAWVCTPFILNSTSSVSMEHCSDTWWCSIARCFIGVLHARDSVLVKLSMKLNITTLKQAATTLTYFKSMVTVTSTPHDLFRTEPPSVSLKVKTLLYQKRPSEESVANWVIGVSVGAGLVLLIILILILWKIGFFRRKEREDLQRLLEGDQEDALLQEDNYDVINSATSPTPLLAPSFQDGFN